MIILLTCAYGGALAVSSAHLAILFRLFNAGLPDYVSLDLAIALEVVAFLFSLISTSLGSEVGPSAARGSTAALLLVWAGNGYAMWMAAPTLPWYVTVGASCFVPICTLMVGKVQGSLFNLLDRLNQERAEREAALNRRQQSWHDPAGRPLGRQSLNPVPVPPTPSMPDITPTDASAMTDREASSATSEASGRSGQNLHIDTMAPTGLNLSATAGLPPAPTEPPVHLLRPIAPSTEIGDPTSGAPYPGPDRQQHFKRPRLKAEEAKVPESSPVPESSVSAATKSVHPRTVKPDLTGIGALAEEALSGQVLEDQTEVNQALFSKTLTQARISWAELDGLTRLVEAGWPPTTTPRLLSARQAVLAWAFVKAKASKTALAEELGLGKKEWIVRDVVKSVDAVLEAVRRSPS